MVADQEERPWLEGVDSIFNGIVDLAREQKDDFVKVVKVKASLLPGGIPEVKIMIILVKIALAADAV